ncbi:DUF5722 domain-containing protein [Paenibacillus thermotolerans]|uniref:DUF5722 domain-containing protein n=1 Tax=Paenibacillus thermotolerans TaxID=3027807 RepID=UPI0023679671|nr:MULTISPECIES: DUF5722 domain-containing protein [unclassified Paenibacillus]
MRKKARFLSVFAAVLLVCQTLLTSAASAAAYDPALTESGHVLKGTHIYSSLIINDFNTPEDVALWKAGENTRSISFATSILNGPGNTYEGAGSLEQRPTQVKAYEWRTIYREFTQPLDLSEHRFLAFAGNSWGFRPGDYFMKVRLYSNDQLFESNVKLKPDSWTTAFIDLASWPNRNAITKMDISFMFNYDLEGLPPGSPGYDYWDGRFQIDYITATNILDFRFSHDGITEGFEAYQGNVGAAQGVLRYAPAEAGSYLLSPIIKENIDERNTLTVKLKNGSPAAQVKLSWITEQDQAWDEEKSKVFAIAPNSGSSVTYDLNMSDKSGWSGNLRRFKLEPLFPDEAGGVLEIDEFEFNILPELVGTLYGSMNDVRIADGRTVRVDGSVDAEAAAAHPNAELVLYELPAYESFQSGATEEHAVATTPVAERYSFEVGLNEGERTRLFSKFFVAIRDGDELLPVDVPKYIVNPDALAESRFPFPEQDSIKGLQVQYTDDAEELGIRHAALNVSYNSYLYKSNNHPDNTIVYRFNGENFYIKKNEIERLDRDIKSLSDNDVVVSLILIMYRSLDPDTPNDILLHPDSEPGGIVYAFNTKNAQGVKYFTAFTNFLAERYSRADERYGRAVNYIVGNEVGQNKVWYNMGPKLIHDYVDDYARTLRLVNTVVKSHYDGARVYVSLDHFWDEDIPSTSLWKYDNRKIIDLLSEKIRSEGDLPWNVAFHPYPENLFDAKFWEDESPTYDFETDRITFKNLEVLVDYMKQDNLLYNGAMRRIILSEQGFHSENTPEGQLVQAAAYAYAYYKIKFLDGIDSFIMHRHVDHAQEGGLNLGLWTNLAGQIATPDQHKKIYDVFKYIDTEKSLEATEFAKAVIGIGDWADVIPGFDPVRLTDRELPAQAGSERVGKPVQFVELSGFEDGTDGWQRADNSQNVERITSDAFSGSASLQVRFNELAKMWRGADLQLSEPIDAAAVPNLSLALKPLGTESKDSYYAKVKVYSGSKVMETTAPLSQGEWNHISLNLEGWDGIASIDRIKVWMNSPTTSRWNGSMLIDAVGFSKRIAPDGGQSNVDIAAELLSERLEPGAQVSVKVTNLDAARLTGDIEIAASDTISFSESSLHVNKIAPGESKTFTLTVSAYNPAASGEIKVAFLYKETVIEQVLAVVKDTGEGNVPVNEKLLYNFENGTQGWQAVSNIDNVGTVESFLNGPNKPILGSFAFSARSSIVAADAWRVVSVVLDRPLDLTEAQTFFYHIDSYGGVPGASYETMVTLYSGTDSIAQTVAMGSDRWNRVSLDLEGWALKNNVTKIEIGFRAVGSSIAWNPEFQLDYIGYAK